MFKIDSTEAAWDGEEEGDVSITSPMSQKRSGGCDTKHVFVLVSEYISNCCVTRTLYCRIVRIRYDDITTVSVEEQNFF